MSPAEIAAIVLVPFVAWRIVRAILAYRGDCAPETRKDALRHFSPEDIDRGRAETRAYVIPGLARAILELAFLWALIFLSLARGLEGLAESASSILPLQVACFVAIYTGLHIVVFAPLDVYSGFILGRRFGTLKQKFRQWLLFHAKGAVVGYVLSWGVFCVFLFLVRSRPGFWWVIVGAALTLFAILLTFLHPIVFAPIFYRFSRLEEGELRDLLLELCRKAGVKAKDVFIQHESKVSTSSNAYFTGIGRSKRIVLFDNLLAGHSPDEIAVVVAHEAGHWSGRHVLVGIGLSAVSIFAGSFLLFCLFRLEGADEFFGTSIGRLSALPSVVLLAALGSAFVAPCVAAVSRLLERRADAAALQLTGNPDAFVSTHVKLARDNRADLLPHPLLVRLYASHPTALQRIRFAAREADSQSPRQ